MQYGTTTSKLTIRSDMPMAVSSSAYGANLNALGFNLVFIMERKPMLAVELMRLAREARSLTVDSPKAPDEDMHLAEVQFELDQFFKRRPQR